MAKKSGDYYIKNAQKNGCNIKYGKGDHVKVYSPDNSTMMIIPRNLKGNGTECAIRKWFLRLGILVVISLAVCYCVL